MVRRGDRLKEKEIRLSRLRRPTAGVGAGRKKKTTAGTDHIFKRSDFIITMRIKKKLKCLTN